MSDELIIPDLPANFAATVSIARLTASASNAKSPRSEVHVRHFKAVVDEPTQRGGTDMGPTPLEYVLLGLAGGVGVSFRLVAQGMQFAYDAIHVDVEADFDSRGRYGVSGVKPFFQACRVRVVLDTNEPDERLEGAAERFERTSPIENLLRSAGVDLTIQFVRD